MAGKKESKTSKKNLNNQDLSPAEKLRLKKRIKEKEKKSTVIKRAITAAFLTISILVVVVLIYGYSLISSLNSHDIISAVEPTGSSCVNILLLGMDIGDTENVGNRAAKRTDTMMLLNYNPRTDKVKVVSIPRDTLIEVENAHDGNGNYIPYWKMNAAYALGGEEEVVEQVEKLLDITVNYLVEIDYEAFRSLVDAIGGVEMYIERDMYYDDDAQDLHINFTKGETVLLDGQKAEEFFRWRKNNDGTGLADGDLGRIKNQQMFATALIEKCTNPSIIMSFPDIVDAIKANVVTNMPGSKIVYYALKMMMNNGVSMATLEGYNERIYGQDFLVVEKSYNTELIESLKITSTVEESVDKSNYKIMILNGTRVNGLAGNMQLELQNIKYNNISVGNADKTQESKILCNDKELKQLLSADTGINNIAKNSMDEYSNYDAVIIIGEDYLVFE